MADNSAEDQCGSRRTVQLGALAAVDLRCMVARWQHREPTHLSRRIFGDVKMLASWPGEFEEPGQ